MSRQTKPTFGIHKIRRPNTTENQAVKPPHPASGVGNSKFPKPDYHEARRGLALSFELPNVVTPLPIPKALAAELVNVTDPDQRCSVACRYIVTQVALGSSFDRVAQALNLQPADIIYWMLDRPLNTTAMATAMDQAADFYDQQARTVIAHLDADRTIDLKVGLAYANSLRSASEAKRAASQGILRKTHLVHEDNTAARHELQKERKRTIMARQRAAEKEASRQRRHSAHEQIVSSVGYPKGPALSDVRPDGADLSQVELQHLMPAETEELQDLMQDDQLPEALGLLSRIRARWRAAHATIPPAHTAQVEPTRTSKTKRKPKDTKP